MTTGPPPGGGRKPPALLAPPPELAISKHLAGRLEPAVEADHLLRGGGQGPGDHLADGGVLVGHRRPLGLGEGEDVAYERLLDLRAVEEVDAAVLGVPGTHGEE